MATETPEDEIVSLKEEVENLRKFSLKNAAMSNVCAVYLKLPPFDTDNLFAWFGMSEAQFDIRPITQSSTKASYILGKYLRGSLPVNHFGLAAAAKNEYNLQVVAHTVHTAIRSCTQVIVSPLEALRYTCYSAYPKSKF